MWASSTISNCLGLLTFQSYLPGFARKLADFPFARRRRGRATSNHTHHSGPNSFTVVSIWVYLKSSLRHVSYVMESKSGVFVYYKNPSVRFDVATRKAIASHASKSSTRRSLQANQPHTPRTNWTSSTVSRPRKHQIAAWGNQRRGQDLQRYAWKDRKHEDDYQRYLSEHSSYAEGLVSEEDFITRRFHNGGSGLYSMSSNGLRADPFNAFPIPTNKHIAPAIDFCTSTPTFFCKSFPPL